MVMVVVEGEGGEVERRGQPGEEGRGARRLSKRDESHLTTNNPNFSGCPQTPEKPPPYPGWTDREAWPHWKPRTSAASCTARARASCALSSASLALASAALARSRAVSFSNSAIRCS